MVRIDNVLVATDFSEPAEGAARRALTLAGGTHSVHLLHVLPTEPLQRIRAVLTGSESRRTREAVLASARQRMEDLRARLAADHSGLLSAEVVEDQPATAIAAYARQGDYGLVALGARGQRGWEWPLAGTTAQKVVRGADRPVLLVRRAPEGGGGYRRVLVAVDFSEASKRALEGALALCPDATVWVLHVFELPFEQLIDYDAMPWEAAEHYRRQGHARAQEDMTRFLAEVADGDRCRPLIRQGEAARIILGMTRAQEVELVAVGSRGLGGLSESLLGSINLHLLHGAECDLLTVKA